MPSRCGLLLSFRRVAEGVGLGKCLREGRELLGDARPLLPGGDGDRLPRLLSGVRRPPLPNVLNSSISLNATLFYLAFTFATSNLFI